MSFQEFGGFVAGIPSPDVVQARLEHQAGLLTNVLGGLYAPLDSAMTYQAAQLAGPVKALKSAATRSVNGVTKALAPIVNTLETVIANRMGEQGGSLASVQGAVAAGGAMQPPPLPQPVSKIGDPGYANIVPALPSPTFPPAASPPTQPGNWRILYRCQYPPATAVVDNVGSAGRAGQYPPQVWSVYQGVSFDTQADAEAYNAINASAILALCNPSPPVPTPTPTPTPLPLPITPPVPPNGPPTPTEGIWQVFYNCDGGYNAIVAHVLPGQPTPLGYTQEISPYFLYESDAADWLAANLAMFKATRCPIGLPPTPPPLPPDPTPTPLPVCPPPPGDCCPDWQALINQLCRCLHATNRKIDPVDLDQPLAFLFGEQKAVWHPKAIAFYGQGLAEIVAAGTLKGLIDLRESQEG